MGKIHNFKSYIDESYNKNSELLQLKQDKKDLEAELKQAWMDMENDPDIEPEGGPVADSWGGKLEDLQKEIEKLDTKIKKMEAPKAKKEENPLAETKKVLMKHAEEIKRSVQSWPDRTLEQAAEIYKKRYFDNDFDQSLIVKALKELQEEKKI